MTSERPEPGTAFVLPAGAQRPQTARPADGSRRAGPADDAEGDRGAPGLGLAE